jgi:hypothetical protein
MGNKKQKFARDWHAVNAHFRNSAGSMGDDRKQASREACRKAVDVEDEYGEEECVLPSGSKYWDW